MKKRHTEKRRPEEQEKKIVFDDDRGRSKIKLLFFFYLFVSGHSTDVHFYNHFDPFLACTIYQIQNTCRYFDEY